MPSLSWPIPAGYCNTIKHWDIPQGDQLTDFVRYPMLDKYPNHMFILPLKNLPDIPESSAPPVGFPWVDFQLLSAAYNHVDGAGRD
jgi:hypothetical protein